MQEVVANVDDYYFDIELALEHQLGAQPLPFPGMDSKHFAIFQFAHSEECDVFAVFVSD